MHTRQKQLIPEHKCNNTRILKETLIKVDTPDSDPISNKYLAEASAIFARVLATARRPVARPSTVPWSRAVRRLRLALPTFCFGVDERASSRVAPSVISSQCYGSSRFYSNPLMVRPRCRFGGSRQL